MTSTAPPARGVRHDWAGLPAPVRAAVEDILGAPVTEARTQNVASRPASPPASGSPAAAAPSSRR